MSANMSASTKVTGREDVSAETRIIPVSVPGSRHTFVYTRTADGRLLTLSGNWRLYVDARSPLLVD